MDTVHGASTINEDELDDLRTGYAEWIETCAVANMSGITSPMVHRHHDPPSIIANDSVNHDQPADPVNDQPPSSSSPPPSNPAIDDCLSCVRENVVKDVGENMVKKVSGDSAKDLAIEIQEGNDSNANIARSESDKNNGKRSRKVTFDHSVKNDREHGSGNIRRVYSLSEVLND